MELSKQETELFLRLIALLDHKWTRRRKEDKSLKDKGIEEIFQRMNVILLDKYIEKVFASSQQAQLERSDLNTCICNGK